MKQKHTLKLHPTKRRLIEKNAKPKEKTCYFERAKLKKEAMRISQKKSDKGKKKEKNQAIED